MAQKYYKKIPDYGLKTRLHLGEEGKIIEWDAQNNTGRVQTNALSDPIDFEKENLHGLVLPIRVGQTVLVKAQFDEKSLLWRVLEIAPPPHAKPTQRTVSSSGSVKRSRKKSKENHAYPIVIYGIFSLLWLIAVFTQSLKLGISYAVASGLSVLLYAWDKRSSRQNGARIPEIALHQIALLGGWAGAIWAQYWFHHKTQKAAFRRIFWCTVIINIIGSIYLLYSGILPQ